MQVTLQIVEGPYKGRFVPLVSGTTRFGNSDDADYPVSDDAELSNLHFGVTLAEDAGIVKDLGSPKGTLINDELLNGERTLKDGDVIRAGASTFRVHFRDLAKSIAMQATIAPASLSVDEADAQEEPDEEGQRPTVAVVPISSPNANLVEWTLAVESGPDSGRHIQLIDKQEVILGSSPKADYMILGDAAVSGMHCQIVCQTKICSVRDLNSSHGTSVNGHDVGQISLKHGDLLKLGDTRFRVILGPISSTPEGISSQASRTIRASRPYSSALEDEDLIVRRLAIEAAVWTRQPWISDYCRQCCQQPLPKFMPAYEMLAILGQRDDLASIQRILGAEALGVERMRVAGMFGYAECIEWLLHQLAHADKAIAAAAAKSFSKICGVSIDSDKRQPVEQQKSSSSDDLEDEFQPEDNLPDIAKARKHWEAHRNQYKKGARWCRGFEIGPTVSPAVFQSLDHESQWEVAMRSQFSGHPLGNPQSLMRFKPR